MPPSSSYEHIAILMAMAPEAQPLIKELQLKAQPTDFARPYPLKIYDGQFRGSKISIVLNGHDQRFNVDSIGTQPAALTAYLSLKHLKPNLIINAGTAGGVKAKGATIGDIFISQAIKYHDRRITLPGGFKPYGVGDYSVIDMQSLAQKLGFKMGVISTGNSLDMSDIDYEMIAHNQGDVKEMEAASIAWVAELFNTPMFAIKSITDLIDVPASTEDQFLKNLHYASEQLQHAVINILPILSVKNKVQAA